MIQFVTQIIRHLPRIREVLEECCDREVLHGLTLGVGNTPPRISFWSFYRLGDNVARTLFASS